MTNYSEDAGFTDSNKNKKMINVHSMSRNDDFFPI